MNLSKIPNMSKLELNESIAKLYWPDYISIERMEDDFVTVETERNIHYFDYSCWYDLMPLVEDLKILVSYDAVSEIWYAIHSDLEEPIWDRKLCRAYAEAILKVLKGLNNE